MNDKESFNNSENNPVETTPWDSVAEDAKTPLEERDGNIQLGVDESLGTEAPAEVDPFDPPLSASDVPPDTLNPDAPPATPDVSPDAPDIPPATPATPEPSEPKTPIEGSEGNTYLNVSETQPTAEPYGGANGENTGDQVNRIES